MDAHWKIILIPRHKYHRDRQCRGFTIIEVVIAFGVIAFAVAAGITAVSVNSNNASGLQQRTYAHWVAMNKMTELQLSGQWPSLRTTKGSALMARQEWFWSMKVSKTPDGFDLIRRVDVTVKLDENEESSLVTLTGFVGKP